ncbi:MAG: hypothetical protein IT355_18530 [Gemmatimonadaceae bacterium]|nr:hypothetical protein [Gemmatimonadaceae bacterium]
MKRILVGIALFITGAIGLVLSFCGAMFMEYASKHGGTGNGDFATAATVTGVGALLVFGVIAYVVRRVRRSRAPRVMTGSIRSTDELP